MRHLGLDKKEIKWLYKKTKKYTHLFCCLIIVVLQGRQSEASWIWFLQSVDNEVILYTHSSLLQHVVMADQCANKILNNIIILLQALRAYWAFIFFIIHFLYFQAIGLHNGTRCTIVNESQCTSFSDSPEIQTLHFGISWWSV